MNATKPIHGAPKPVDVPSDMQDTPPRTVPFKVGDLVTYTNGNGLEGRARIRGFAKEPHGGHFVPVKVLGFNGAVVAVEQHKIPERFIYLEHWSAQGWRLGAWWFAAGPECLRSIDAGGSR